MRSTKKPNRLVREAAVMILTVLFTAQTVSAAHPLITDDTGTQGKGCTQVEFLGEYGRTKETGVRTDTFVLPTVPAISYGLTDEMDLVAGASYQYDRSKDGEDTTRVRGITDTTIDLKWRFYEKNGLSFALKPGITLPTGNHEKGLGAGRTTYHLSLIGTREFKPWAVHFNIGYTRNENTLQERRDLWHGSLAAVLDMSEKLKAVANVGVDRDPSRDSDGQSRFVLGGLIWSVMENLDIDAGIKIGSGKRERSYSFPAGITWRF